MYLAKDKSERRQIAKFLVTDIVQNFLNIY
jgi:hypothetical protein